MARPTMITLPFQNLRRAGGKTGTVTDIDGNVYPIVQIGEQWWLAENLRVTHYRNGDPINNLVDERWQRGNRTVYLSAAAFSGQNTLSVDGPWGVVAQAYAMVTISGGGNSEQHRVVGLADGTTLILDGELTHSYPEGASVSGSSFFVDRRRWHVNNGVIGDEIDPEDYDTYLVDSYVSGANSVVLQNVVGIEAYWVYLGYELLEGAHSAITPVAIDGGITIEQVKRQYGALYNWHTVVDERGLCPEGWRVASDNDWQELEVYLGMAEWEAEIIGHRGVWIDQNIGGKLKGVRSFQQWGGHALGNQGDSHITATGSNTEGTDAGELIEKFKVGDTIRISGWDSDGNVNQEDHIVTGKSGTTINIDGHLANDYVVYVIEDYNYGKAYGLIDLPVYPSIEKLNEYDPHVRWGRPRETMTGRHCPNIGATNETGFNAYPSPGVISSSGGMGYFMIRGQWWTTTPYEEEHSAISRRIKNHDYLIYPDTPVDYEDIPGRYRMGHGVTRRSDWKTAGFSVRCVKE